MTNRRVHVGEQVSFLRFIPHIVALLFAYGGFYFLENMAQEAAFTFSSKPYIFASILFVLLAGFVFAFLKPLPVIATGVFFVIHLVMAAIAFMSMYFGIGGDGLRDIALAFGFKGYGLIYIGLFFVSYYAVMAFRSPDLKR